MRCPSRLVFCGGDPGGQADCLTISSKWQEIRCEAHFVPVSNAPQQKTRVSAAVKFEFLF
jgi:hypothetical protein